MSAGELIAEFADWKLFLLAIFIYAICPQWVLRLLVRVYAEDDPRRHELLGELYAVAYIKRPFWVAEQFETVLADGVWPRFMWMLTGRVILRWKLGNGVKRHKKHPLSFWIPSDEQKAQIGVDDAVKLVFEQSDGWHERMWVSVTKVGRYRLTGYLDNPPISFPRLAYGDTVKFRHKHIIDIDPKASHYVPYSHAVMVGEPESCPCCGKDTTTGHLVASYNPPSPGSCPRRSSTCGG